MRRILLAFALVVALAGSAAAQDRYLTLASTTSTEDSGLFRHLLPLFQLETGVSVRVVAVGTGQALLIGKRGDADALLVHDRPGEDAFVASGDGIDRRDVMYNDFIIVGPAADPAKVAGLTDAVEALRRIATAAVPFASRGDDSGTDRREKKLWKLAGIDPTAAKGGWYRSLGAGMGPTLNTAAAMDAYALADRATWLNFKNARDLRLLVEGDKRLFNQYGSILVNPERHPGVHSAEARLWHEWLTSPLGQQAIADFRIGGKEVFFPDYKRPAS